MTDEIINSWLDEWLWVVDDGIAKIKATGSVEA